MIDQRLSRDFPTKSAVHPSQRRTAAPMSGGDGPKENGKSSGAIYNCGSLPDKAALITAIAADDRLRASTVRVGTVLLFKFHNTKSGRCDPSYETLGKAAALKRRAAIKAVHQLEQFAWLVKRPKGRRSRNSYQFAFRRVSQGVYDDAPLDDSSGASQCAAAVHEDALQECIGVHPIGVPTCTQTQDDKPGREPKKGTQDSFDEDFWQAYPKRVDRKEAKRIYDRIVRKAEATPAQLLAGAQRYAEECRAARKERQYIKSPVTWLNKGCWEDEPAPPEALNRHRATNDLSRFSEAVVRRACGGLEGRQ